MMKASRTWSMILAGSLCCTALAGCGETNAANNTGNGGYSDTITLVWYPNESAEDYQASRDEIGRLIEQATGKKVEQKLTTDYAIAIESLASGTAQIGCCMGAEGYIQAKNSNDAVNPLFVQSGESGTLDDALYHSFFAVRSADATQYQDGDSYQIDNIKGKRISFVSNSSTSGFLVPTTQIISHFAADNLIEDDLLEGGEDYFFSEVLFGGSHQGSAFNLLSDKCDVAAFCDIELAPYATCVEGEEAQTGCVYAIRDDANAPFDTVTDDTYTVILSIPVLNGPFAYNGDTLSPEDVQAIQALFTSEEVANNELIFYPEGGKGLLEKESDAMGFVTVDDAWYDPIRNMGE